MISITRKLSQEKSVIRDLIHIPVVPGHQLLLSEKERKNFTRYRSQDTTGLGILKMKLKVSYHVPFD